MWVITKELGEKGESSPTISYEVIVGLSCLPIISYSSSSPQQTKIYNKDPLMYVWGTPSER